MDLDRRAAAWLESHLRADGPLHDFAKRFDFEGTSLQVKYTIAIGALLPGGFAPVAKEIFDAVHEAMLAVEPALSHLEAEPAKSAAEQAKDEVERATAKSERAEGKSAQTKADAELGAAVIEEQSILLQQQISEQEATSKEEVAALKKVFEQEEQELTGKLDAMARKYFEKHPDLGADLRDEATATFNKVKDEALTGLRGGQETRMKELTGPQEKHREELEERKKELDGTRAGR